MKNFPDYDTSVILSIRSAIEVDFIDRNYADFFYLNGLEVVLIYCDANLDVCINNLLYKFNFTNWKMIYLNIENYFVGQILNFAICYSTKKYILALSPYMIPSAESLFSLRCLLDIYPEQSSALKISSLKKKDFKYDIILTTKSILEAIGGYLHCSNNFACIYLNLKNKLLNEKYDILYNSKNKFTNIDVFPSTIYSILKKQNKKGSPILTNFTYSPFVQIIFDWEMPSHLRKYQLLEYLGDDFLYQLKSDDIFLRKFQCIALISTFNEETNINTCLTNISKYCDGIILLDDGSSDSTYESINSSNVILKLKKERDSFNDLKNRNILLKTVSFFCSSWLFFVDADECLDCRFSNFKELINNCNQDIIGVWIVNLWNNSEYYRYDMDDSSLYSQESGLWLRWRIFRHKGYLQIISDNILHFTTIPYRTTHHISKLLLLHSGYINIHKREKKYKFYQIEDRQKVQTYDELLDRSVEIRRVNDITENILLHSAKEFQHLTDQYIQLKFYRLNNIL